MSLIIVVISLILEFFVGRWQHLRRLEWLVSLRQALYSGLPADWTSGWRGLLVLIVPILLVMLFLQYLIGGHMHGILRMLFGIAVLTYCLGPESLNELINDYLKACEKKDTAEAQTVAKKILLTRPIPESIHNLSFQVTREVFYEANKRIFAILFWFLLLGPAGALLYRLIVFLAEENVAADKNQALPVYSLMDWMPARLLALTFFMAGSYDDASRAWRKCYHSKTDWHARSRLFVVATGCAAMRHEVNDLVEQPGNQEEYDLKWLQTARVLIIRSLLIWVAAIALLTFAGVFV